MKNTAAIPSSLHERWRAIAAAALLASMLAACGGGSGSNDNTATAPPPSPPRPPASTCIDPTPAVASTVASVVGFAQPASAAASSAQVSDSGSTACFTGTAVAGAASSTAVAQGADSFYYFEATRSQVEDVAMGVSVSALSLPGASGAFEPRTDTLMVSGDKLVTSELRWSADTPPVLAAQTVSVDVGAASAFGFAVDLRAAYPVVWVIGRASDNATVCAPLAGNTPCVLWRKQLDAPAATLSIYAHGSGQGNVTTGPKVTLNSGANPLAKPFVFDTAAVRAAMADAWPQGERGLIAQWPPSSGAAAAVALARASHGFAVVQRGDAAPRPAALAVTATNAGAGVVAWQDELGASHGSGVSLSLTRASIVALALGDHTLTASVVDPATGRSARTSFRLRILAANANGDDDGDGLSFSDEKTKGTQPGNPDSDGDGLSDGAELALGKNPTTADNGSGTAVRMAAEFGVTGSGVVIADDGLSLHFTSQLNPACAQHLGAFAAPLYDSAIDPYERCRKRAVRASQGVARGEFRYFETQRLGAPENMGHGVIAQTAAIDPYCCFVQPGEAGHPYAGTPPSLGINSVGGVFVRLTNDGTYPLPAFATAIDLEQTVFYGVAVDYRGTDPVIHVVATAADGSMTVSGGVTLADFGGGPVMPMVYGHPMAGFGPHAALNFGLRRFHYDLTALRAALEAQAAGSGAALVPGVGIHRW